MKLWSIARRIRRMETTCVLSINMVGTIIKGNRPPKLTLSPDFKQNDNDRVGGSEHHSVIVTTRLDSC